jgi:hypothetical protein
VWWHVANVGQFHVQRPSATPQRVCIKVTTSGGRRHAQLVESFRNEVGRPRQRTLATLGRLAHGGDVDRLIQSLHSAQGRQDAGSRASAAVQNVHLLQSRSAGDVWALWQLWQSLGLEGLSLVWGSSRCKVDTLARLRAAVFNRLCDPPPLGVLRWCQAAAERAAAPGCVAAQIRANSPRERSAELCRSARPPGAGGGRPQTA